MRKLFTILITLLLTASAFAQPPNKMSYQAVIRDASDNIVHKQAVGMQISILQGSTSGTAVYAETHKLTTNANGLVSLEIGAGTVVTGSFSTINWPRNTYFIKTETDPSGGTNYTITGISQILSVPYALHANTADSVAGGIIEVDPYFLRSQAANITATDITNLGNLSGTISTLATITALRDSIAQLRNDISGKLTIGQAYQGGFIFWLDESGQHGLIIAPRGRGIYPWSIGTDRRTSANRDGIRAGIYNTEQIIATMGHGNYPAMLSHQYKEGGYGDWYLPSSQEFKLIYDQKALLVGLVTDLVNDHYWTSTEYGVDVAQAFDFSRGNIDNGSKFLEFNIHFIRAF